MEPLLNWLRHGTPDARLDADLIAAFITHHDELAFSEVVRRHGPIVWGVCRRMLPDPADADDAFQATFLVLIRRGYRPPAPLGPWLYRVAVLTARKLRQRNARRLTRFQTIPADLAAPAGPSQFELDGLLLRMPEKYRIPVILCHVEGLTEREAADRLRCPVGTLSARVSRGLQWLRRRAGADPRVVLAAAAVEVVPSATEAAAVRIASIVHASQLGGAVPASVAQLVTEVSRSMILSKILVAFLAIPTALLLGTAGMATFTRPVNPDAHLAVELPTPRAQDKQLVANVPVAAAPPAKPSKEGEGEYGTLGPPRARPAEPGAKALSEGQELKPKTAEKELSKEDKEELASRLWSLRNLGEKRWSNDRYNLIGNLVENGWWNSQLPLCPAQASIIMKLDSLIRDASDNTGRMLADSLEKTPAGFRETLARFDKRLHESIEHGQRLVALGLLTEPQAAYVLYRYTSDGNNLYVLRDLNIQKLLGMTAAQDKELDKVGDAANRREWQLNLWSVDPIEQDYVRTVMTANAKRMNAEALRVLTPEQRKVWDAFTAKRILAAKAPEMPAPTKAEMERIKISEKSAIFRMLAEKENTLKLTEAQKKLVNRLEEVAQAGLYWISLRKPDSAAAVERLAKVSAEFIQHAEQIVLSCILTEQQAEQIKSAIAKADSGTKPKN